MPEWIGTIFFFLAIGLTAAKVSRDIGRYGLLGYAVLLAMTFIYAAAVGAAYV